MNTLISLYNLHFHQVIIFIACAQTTKGIEKQQLIERAEEALGDSVKFRSQLLEKITDSNQKLKGIKFNFHYIIIFYHMNCYYYRIKGNYFLKKSFRISLSTFKKNKISRNNFT